MDNSKIANLQSNEYVKFYKSQAEGNDRETATNISKSLAYDDMKNLRKKFNNKLEFEP